MSNWIEAHSNLKDHPKVKRLRRALGLSQREAIGGLMFFWWWCMDYAPDGDLSGFETEDIAEAFGQSDSTTDTVVVDALLSAGFIDRADDGTLRVHDWQEYGEKLHRRRQANAERMREARAKHVQQPEKRRATHVQNTCEARAEHVQSERTGQDMEYRTESTPLSIPPLSEPVAEPASAFEPVMASDLPGVGQLPEPEPVKTPLSVWVEGRQAACSRENMLVTPSRHNVDKRKMRESLGELAELLPGGEAEVLVLVREFLESPPADNFEAKHAYGPAAFESFLRRRLAQPVKTRGRASPPANDDVCPELAKYADRVEVVTV